MTFSTLRPDLTADLSPQITSLLVAAISRVSSDLHATAVARALVTLVKRRGKSPMAKHAPSMLLI
jgi:hypothetical protein